MEDARRFVINHIAPEVTLAAAEDFSGNYKSYLQQLAQREYGVTPTYQLLDEQGPDHSKCFQVAALIGAKSFEPAWGRNKKEAEQRAACNALSQLAAESLPPVAD
jgi:ribonuclease-3